MSNQKHTPGPWRFSRHRRNGGYSDLLRIHPRGSPDVIAGVHRSCGGGEDGAIANAHLIAAAPDLLEALELHRAYEATPADRGGANGPKGRARTEWLAARDAAIAKARNQAGGA